MPRENLIKLRNGNASAWSVANPVLSAGEPGYDSTNNILKIGNGVANWSTLSPTAKGSQVQSYNTVSNFPNNGAIDVLFIALNTNRIYRWNGSAYQEIGPLDFFYNGVEHNLPNGSLPSEYPALINSLPLSPSLNEEHFLVDKRYRWNGHTWDIVSFWELFLPPEPVLSANIEYVNNVGLCAVVSWPEPDVCCNVVAIEGYVIYYSSDNSTWTRWMSYDQSGETIFVNFPINEVFNFDSNPTYYVKVAAVNPIGVGKFDLISVSPPVSTASSSKLNGCFDFIDCDPVNGFKFSNCEELPGYNVYFDCNICECVATPIQGN